MQRYSDKWAFVEDDSDLDEEGQGAHVEATELREQANAAAHFANGLPHGEVQNEKLREAIAMYCRAYTHITRVAAGRSLAPKDRELVLQCRLNAACLALKLKDEKATSRLCNEVFELDAENAHAALFLAHLALWRQESKLVEQWLQKARRWAHERGDDSVLRQVSEFAYPAQSKAPTTKAGAPISAETPNPAVWVKKGVELLKQRQPVEARRLLEQAIEFMDREEHGGPIERLSCRGPRVNAFDALEALAEALAAAGVWREASRCANRAAALLDPGPGEAPFSEPEVHRREGLLFISMGHIHKAAKSDPLPIWRHAVYALQKYGDDPAAEGHALLEVGLWIAEHNRPGSQIANDTRSVEEAVLALDNAGDRFKKARMKLSTKSLDSKSEKHIAELTLKEFRARTELASLLCVAGELGDAATILEASSYLLGLVPERPPEMLALDWADLCGKWAFAATQAGRLHEAEEALKKQHDLGEMASSVETQLAALQALAVVRRKQQNEPGVKVALTAVERLTGDPGQVTEVLKKLRRVAPAGITTNREASLDRVHLESAKSDPTPMTEGVKSSGAQPEPHDTKGGAATSVNSRLPLWGSQRQVLFCAGVTGAALATLVGIVLQHYTGGLTG